MKVQEYLETHLPPHKAAAILSYLSSNHCSLRITRPRKTKRGDFRQYRDILSISVNHDENSYRFLFTLIHEIAHLKTYLEYKNKVKPHGTEWKNNFRELFIHFEMAEEYTRDEHLKTVVLNELKNPKAASGVGLDLEKAFAVHDQSDLLHLEEISEGDRFIFRGVVYQKMESRRSRVMCLNMANNRKYTISKAANVERC